MTALCWIFGLANAANGLWMLLAPARWYHHLPAGVPDTGPLNAHFVRDIGAAFLTICIAFCIAAWKVRYRRAVVLAATLFFGLHALVHVTDLFGGRLHHDHWLVDLPGVFVPAIALAVWCLPRWWSEQA